MNNPSRFDSLHGENSVCTPPGPQPDANDTDLAPGIEPLRYALAIGSLLLGMIVAIH